MSTMKGKVNVEKELTAAADAGETQLNRCSEGANTSCSYIQSGPGLTVSFYSAIKLLTELTLQLIWPATGSVCHFMLWERWTAVATHHKLLPECVVLCSHCWWEASGLSRSMYSANLSIIIQSHTECTL